MRQWHSIESEVLTLPPGMELKIWKWEVYNFPSWLHETILGDAKGAIKQYRDSKKTNNLHVREYQDFYTIHFDRFNPEHDSILHLIHDAPLWGLGLLGGALVLWDWWSKREKDGLGYEY